MVTFYCVKVCCLDNFKRFMKRQSFKKALVNREKSLQIPKSSRVMLTLRGEGRV